MEYSISVIIPFYNAKKYLVSCVECLKQQSLSNVEIIFVNDGSSDGGERIIEEHMRGMPNIRLINKANSGLGDSRNCAMAKAKGKYIYFLDADDYIAQDALEKVYSLAESTNADLVCFNSINIIDGVDFFPKYEDVPESYKMGGLYTSRQLTPGIDYDGRDFVIRCLNSKCVFAPVAWLYLYKRDFLYNNMFQFQPIIHEDTIFGIDVATKANRVVYLDEILHFRRVVPTSLMNRKKGDKHISGGLKALSFAVQLYNKEGIDYESRSAFRKWCFCCAGLVYREMKEADSDCRKKFKRQFLEILIRNINIFYLKFFIKAFLTL